MFNKACIIACCLLFSASGAATELTRVVLKDGTEVVLNDDFTWQYVLLTTPNADTKAAQLTPALMANSALMTTNVSQGVRVTFKSARWDDGELGLDFDIENISPLTVLKVTIAATLFDDSGNKILTTEFDVWQAKNRLPETYLRKGQQRVSRTFKLDDINATQWQKQLINLAIIAVETR
ncbi:DUF3157 family protein [Moritella sp.]|uniref:DUF3157 family protein n=1 Tax=Moritella sp. TaxID=78556 RepID=UPI001D43503A|nr:DUF3157 family protein [Moritella sp.]MCJ8350462.1 DUF3157 family protein [Moritella sp.]NQZ40155.1 DUF3157 family protein [Moritella sp.]